MRIPNKLTSSPIIDATVELRVTDTVNVLILYSFLADIFTGGVEELGILQIPQAIRDSDPTLKFQPTHKFKTTSGYYFNAGPHVFGFGYVKNPDVGSDYPGWTDFYAQFKIVFDKLKTNGMLDNISRIGLRFINLFNDDTFLAKLNVSLNPSMEGYGEVDNVNIGFVLRNGDIATRVVINTGATANINGIEIKGQVLDIDSHTESADITSPLNTIKNLHKNTKNIFFTALTQDYVNELGPSYDE